MDKDKEIKEKEREKEKEKDKLKPFTVTHQKVTLDVEFSSRTIFATTELQIFLNTLEVPFLRLHSKNCDIENILVNDIPVKFELFDPCIQLCKSEELSKQDCDYTMFQRLFDFARTSSEQGELTIEIPESIVLKEHLAPEVAAKTAEKEASNESSEPKKPSTPLIVKIDYSISQPELGLMFSANRRVEDETASYLYTTNQLGPGDARCWVPSLDEAHEKCTWELDFIVGKGVEEESKEPGFTVIASGVQIHQDQILEESRRSFFRYFVPFPCPAYLLSFAIGKFDSTMLTELENYSETALPENGEVDSNKKVTAYSPVGWKEELRNTCQTVVKIMEFYLNEFGSYPLDSVKLVFLQTSHAPIFIGAEVIILSLEFLHPEEVIDQTYESRRVIALALASQWFGVGVVPKSSPDIWLVLGLSGFMTSLFLKTHLGRNEYRYRMKQDMLKIANLDTSRPPLFNPRLACPYDSEDIDFIRLKATFVLYMLDKQMMKGAASAGLHRLMPKMLVSAMCGELGMGNTLSTAWFMRTCRKMSGVDLKSFADQWIFCSGCPRFQFSYSFNRKKMVVEITVHQSHTNVGILNDPAIDLDLIKPARFFSGHMTASIREPDGTPYEHVLEIQEDVNRFEVQFNTKYKRIRRNTKRFLKRKAEAAAAEAIVKDHLDGDNAAHDDLFLAEEGKDKEKKEWRIVEWGEADEESLESATFEWIRLDSDFEWICQIELQQPDYMWAGQLEKDRDVVSQFEAVEALKRFPSQATSTTLLRTVMNSQCFYRVRADAAMALVSCDREEFDFIGRHHLLRSFHKKYCVEDDLDERSPELFVPRPLDFSNLAEYFVQKAVVLAISQLHENRPEPVSHRLLLNLLKNNDNSNNAYSDCYFVSTLVTALGNALTTTGANSSSGQLLVEELKRYATMDCLIPSYHNVVTVSCLQTFTRLFLAEILPTDLKTLMHHSRYGNFLHVRMAAFDGLLLLDGLLIPKVRTYLLSTIEVDPDHHLRAYIATNIARLTAIYLGKQAELSERPTRWTQFQNCPEVRTALHRILTNPHLDPRLRRTLNVLCSLLYPSPVCPLNLTAFQIRITEALPARPKLIALPPNPIALPPNPPQASAPAPLPSIPPEQPPIIPQAVASPKPHTPPFRPATPPAKPPIEVPDKPAHKVVVPTPDEPTAPAKPPAKLPVKAPPIASMPDDDMVIAKRLNRRLFGYASAEHFLDTSHPYNLRLIGAKLNKGQYASLEELQSDLAEMLVFFKKLHRKDPDLSKAVLAFEDFYHLQLDKLQGKMPNAPSLKLHVNPPRPPSPEQVKITIKVNKPARPPQNDPPPVTVKDTTYKRFSSRDEYDKAKNILAKILDAPEAEPFLLHLDENSVNIGLKGARRKLKCSEYASRQQMYDDIKSTISFISKLHPRDSQIYRQGRFLRKHFDALWHEAFPDALKPQEPGLIKAKAKQQPRSPEHVNTRRHHTPTLPRGEPVSNPKARHKYKNRSPSLGLPSDEAFDDFGLPPSHPREDYIEAQPERKGVSSVYLPDPGFSDHMSPPPADVRSTKPSQKPKRRSPSPFPPTDEDFLERRSPSPIQRGQPNTRRSLNPKASSPSPAPGFSKDHRPRSSNKPSRDGPFESNKRKQKIRSSMDGLFAEYNSPPPVQPYEEMYGSNDRSPLGRYSEEQVVSDTGTKAKNRRAPMNESPVFADEPQPDRGRNRHPRPFSPLQDEVTEGRRHKSSRDELKQRSRKKSPSPAKKPPSRLIDSPHSKGRHKHRQNERDPAAEVSYRQRPRPSSPFEDLHPADLTPGVMPRHRSAHFEEDKNPFDRTPGSPPRYQPEFSELTADASSHQRIAQEESVPTRKIKIKLGAFSPKRSGTRNPRSLSPRDRVSPTAGRIHRKRSPSPTYDLPSPGSRRKHRGRQKSPEPSSKLVFDELNPFIDQQSKRRQRSPAPIHEDDVAKRRHKQPKLSPRASEPLDPPGIKIKASNNDLLYVYCKRVLDELDRHPSAPSFRLPVDPVLLGIPTYFDIIKHPMDLQTARTRLEKHQYTSFEEFDRDVLLITQNACLFNLPETWVHFEALHLQKHYLDFKAGFDGHFLSQSDVRRFRELLSNLSQGSYIRTFNPPTQFCRYMPEPIDVDRLGTLLNTDHFSHLGEIENAFKLMLLTAYSLFTRGSPEFKDALRLEKHYTSQFGKLFKRPSLFMGELSQQEPWLLMTPERKTECMKIIKKLIAMKAALHFSNPVDYVSLDLPHYPTIIRQPMDLSTIKKKLTSDAYCTLDQLERDVALIVRNCYNFNGPDSDISADATKLEASFKKELTALKAKLIPKPPVPASPAVIKVKALPKALSTKLPQPTVKLMQAALGEIKSHKQYPIFGSPVDYVALKIPQYPQIIQHPMDFGTIQTKLNAGKYLTVDGFLKDASLVFTNCYKFNFPGDPVYIAGQDMEREWDCICQTKGLHRDTTYLSTEEISIVSPKVVIRPPKQQPSTSKPRPKPPHPKAKPSRQL